MNWIPIEDYIPKHDIAPWRKITKISGPVERHIEQLWDEVKSLKERVKILEEEKRCH